MHMYRAVANNRATEALASAISFVFVVLVTINNLNTKEENSTMGRLHHS